MFLLMLLSSMSLYILRNAHDDFKVEGLRVASINTSHGDLFKEHVARVIRVTVWRVRGGGHSGTKWLPTAKRLHGAESVNPKI